MARLRPEPLCEQRLPSLKALALVEAKAEVERDDVNTESQRFTVASNAMSAKAFAQAVRARWAIENSLLSDVTFDEDRTPPQGPRPEIPRHPAKARRQPAAFGQARTLHPTKTQTLRLFRRLRPNHSRPKVIAVIKRTPPR